MAASLGSPRILPLPLKILPGGTRLGPFLEFNVSRLQDGNGNGVDEYLDPLPSQTQAYLYFSSYDGRGYECLDWNLIAGLTDVYRQTAGETDLDGDCVLDTAEDLNSNGRFDFGSPWNQKSFQIISPGFDTAYGVGGVFDPDTVNTVLLGTRDVERDNITNFHGGALAN